MNDVTLALLRCIAPVTSAPAERDPIESARCAGALVTRDTLTLVCERCGAEYPIRSDIPHLLPPGTPASQYDSDERIQAYYEMQYAPYISGTDLVVESSFPQPTIRRRAHQWGTSVEGFADLRQRRDLSAASLREHYQTAEWLTVTDDLTEEFYQTVIDLVRPFVDQDTVALDLGCGLGRVAAEVARLGVNRVVGADLSARMMEEAARLVESRAPVPIKLNVVAGKTIPAQIETHWQIANCDFLVADALRLAVQDQAFDLVLCLNVVDRVPQPHRLIAEITRVVKSGGLLVITDPYDWEEQYTPRQRWVDDMSALFDPAQWQLSHEIDGVPFMMRIRTVRHITLYMDHLMVWRKREDQTPPA